MTHRDDACPYDWAEFNLPPELCAAGRPALTPFGRRAITLRSAAPNAATGWPFGAPSKASAGLGALLVPDFGLGPVPKP